MLRWELLELPDGKTKTANRILHGRQGSDERGRNSAGLQDCQCSYHTSTPAPPRILDSDLILCFYHIINIQLAEYCLLLLQKSSYFGYLRHPATQQHTPHLHATYPRALSSLSYSRRLGPHRLDQPVQFRFFKLLTSPITSCTRPRICLRTSEFHYSNPPNPSSRFCFEFHLLGPQNHLHEPELLRAFIQSYIDNHTSLSGNFWVAATLSEPLITALEASYCNTRYSIDNLGTFEVTPQ